MGCYEAEIMNEWDRGGRGLIGGGLWIRKKVGESPSQIGQEVYLCVWNMGLSSVYSSFQTPIRRVSSPIYNI